MLGYVLRRLVLIVPTLFGIMLVNFVIIQAAPGGPVEQTIARIKGAGGDPTSRIGGSARGDAPQA
ncbi:MAG: microcin ABC transporter permease, partial [Candidatus Rokuibacteriota bacterium]